MSDVINAQGQLLDPDPWAEFERQSLDDWAELNGPTVLRLAHDLDAASIPQSVLDTAAGIELEFPAFSDGRAYSQARKLRERGVRLGIRATGDVLADQLLYMRRCGFDSFALAAGQSLDTALQCLAAFKVAAQPSFDDQGLKQRRTFARGGAA
nr:DUF934 domain-containing protein [Oceanococcus sp. HetDA_MAG_MS8]